MCDKISFRCPPKCFTRASYCVLLTSPGGVWLTICPTRTPPDNTCLFCLRHDFCVALGGFCLCDSLILQRVMRKNFRIMNNCVARRCSCIALLGRSASSGRQNCVHGRLVALHCLGVARHLHLDLGGTIKFWTMLQPKSARFNLLKGPTGACELPNCEEDSRTGMCLMTLYRQSMTECSRTQRPRDDFFPPSAATAALLRASVQQRRTKAAEL